MKYKGRWLENVHVDGPSRCIKQGGSLPAWVWERQRSGRRIAARFRYVNAERPCQGLDYLMRDDIFYRRKPLPKAA